MSKNILIDERSAIASRRRFLKQALCGCVVASGASGIATAGILDAFAATHKTIALHNPSTGDQLALTYFEQGRYIKEALRDINYLLRDYHSGDVHPIDPMLVDQLYDLKQLLGIRRPIQVISGYRSPATNHQLRRQSQRVAKHSLHMEGRAIDIRIEGMSTRVLKNAALAMQRGGVGYYHREDFVHLDTGDIRAW
jgi:uncharacterized protein YcbK (DUF882 family)